MRLLGLAPSSHTVITRLAYGLKAWKESWIGLAFLGDSLHKLLPHAVPYRIHHSRCQVDMHIHN